MIFYDYRSLFYLLLMHFFLLSFKENRFDLLFMLLFIVSAWE